MANLKELAKKTELSTQYVVATVASELNTAVSGQMPGIPLMKRTILRVREPENAAQGIPQSLYDLVTNNSVEGWHNGFSSILNAIHPNIWKFIRALQKEEKLNHLKMVQYCTGAETPRKRKKYNDTA
ncbi:hypothetical protein QTP88_007372 [Uroleucon formosanum]